MQMSTTLNRGPIEWELELEFDVEASDPSVGIMPDYCILNSIEAYQPLTGKLVPFAVTEKEFEELEIWINENYEDDYYDEYDD